MRMRAFDSYSRKVWVGLGVAAMVAASSGAWAEEGDAAGRLSESDARPASAAPPQEKAAAPGADVGVGWKGAEEVAYDLETGRLARFGLGVSGLMSANQGTRAGVPGVLSYVGYLTPRVFLGWQISFGWLFDSAAGRSGTFGYGGVLTGYEQAVGSSRWSWGAQTLVGVAGGPTVSGTGRGSDGVALAPAAAAIYQLSDGLRLSATAGYLWVSDYARISGPVAGLNLEVQYLKVLLRN